MAKARPRSPEGIDTYVGHKLRQVRTSAGMSQTDLANELGITFQQIQKYEKGTNRISVSRLYRIAKLLGVSFDFFVDGFEGNSLKSRATPQQQRLEEMLTNKSTMKLAMYYQLLDNNLQQNILSIMKEMVGDP
ncbi:MAG: helix-turn-helix transcriptional regulator [Pseudomonadota bacterium]|nr:XRE family transcriptional regulator [Pseudomonadota bacterium]QKK05120.1 MAG: helix-turn-helix transcriptional regulator [Pseudomonadota bacterium]